ncbi:MULTISPECIES: DUF6233 domain-containing protein [unclassified Streptomyces]|uniref:DUF6233 domain-containing protein n=1 Tax=unclassified Streptomyces TaxID=2593676 RepID=UPI003B64101D
MLRTAERIRRPFQECEAPWAVRSSRPPEQTATAAPPPRKRCRPLTAAEARRALSDGVRARTHCRPDTALGVLD